ncbi:hypothetical protein H0H81_007835, partial [Sphagnurus paluster]
TSKRAQAGTLTGQEIPAVNSKNNTQIVHDMDIEITSPSPSSSGESPAHTDAEALHQSKAEVDEAQKQLESVTEIADAAANAATIAVNLAEVAAAQAMAVPISAMKNAAHDLACAANRAIQAAAAAKYSVLDAHDALEKKTAHYETLLALSADHLEDHQPNHQGVAQGIPGDIVDESEDGAVIDDIAVHGGTLDDDDDEPKPEPKTTSTSKSCDPEASMPPGKEEAQKAHEDLSNLLHPPRKSGRGYIDPHLDSWTRTCLEAMQMLLWTYISNDISWKDASKNVAQMHKHGKDWGRQLRR